MYCDLVTTARFFFTLILTVVIFVCSGTEAFSSEVSRSHSFLRLDSYLSTVTFGTVPWRRRWFPQVSGEEVYGGQNLRYLIQGPETLIEMARLFDLGFNELRDSNPQVNVWLPEPGTVVRIPFLRVLPLSTARVVVNIPEMRVYHHRRDGWLDTYPIGIGREGLTTPLGHTVVVRKMAAPSWYVPASILKEKPSLPKVMPPGPENPLGTHAVYLSMPGYLMHGTAQPYGIGRRVSHGCIRLYPEDIIRFFNEVRVKDTVEIVNQPVKAGWQGENMFLEVHDVLSLKEREKLPAMASSVIFQAMKRKRFKEEVVLDWRRVENMVKTADGVPDIVGQAIHPLPAVKLPRTGWETRLRHYTRKIKVVAPVAIKNTPYLRKERSPQYAPQPTPQYVAPQPAWRPAWEPSWRPAE